MEKKNLHATKLDITILNFILEKFFSASELSFKEKLGLFLKELLPKEKLLHVAMESFSPYKSGINTAHKILGLVLISRVDSLIEEKLENFDPNKEKKVIEFVLSRVGHSNSMQDFRNALQNFFETEGLEDSLTLAENAASCLSFTHSSGAINVARGIAKRILEPKAFLFKTTFVS